jgi:hypothetical protein
MKAELRKKYNKINKSLMAKRKETKLKDKGIYTNSVDKIELEEFAKNHFTDAPEMNGYKQLNCAVNAINHIVGKKLITLDHVNEIKKDKNVKGNFI